MPEPATRRSFHPAVRSAERLTPSLVRIVFGDDLHGFAAGAFTDHYVKLHFPPPGAQYAPPFEVADVKGSLPREQWPRTRTYSVRAWDPERELLTVDFVVHGDEGIAAPWAANARPGDLVQLSGPGGAYAPDPRAAWHLMVGDLSALPAISASLERVPDGVPVHAIVELDDEADRQALTSTGALEITWLRADGTDRPLADAVAALDFPDGAVHAFVHGEAMSVRAVRRHLLVDRGVPREALSASGYWKRNRTEEGWREDKPEWKRLADADLVGAAD